MTNYIVRKSLVIGFIILFLGASIIPNTSGNNKQLGFFDPFTKHIIDENFEGARCVYACDVDGDTDVDIIGAAHTADEIAWWENDGSQSFTKHIIDENFGGAWSVYACDVDGDNDIDILGTARTIDDIAWWENDGSQSFTKHIIDGNFGGAWSVYACDVDGDNDIDILGTARNAHEIAWWENDGSQSFTKHTIDSDFTGAFSVYACDVDGDTDVDVLGSAYCVWKIAWYENDGSQSFTKHIIDGNFAGADSVYACDVDGDTDVDVLGAAYYDSVITWYENDGSQSFTKHIIDGNFGGAFSVYACDVDGDTDVDVLGAAYGDGIITWYENDGSQSFTKHIIDENFEGARYVYACDVDGDTDVDVLGAADSAGDIAWWENHDNTLPNEPSNPLPADGAIDVDIAADLSWTCSDPDGDDLVYDVYFEVDNPNPNVKVSDDQTETNFDPGIMDINMNYYWKIIAKDEHGAINIGPIWHFTTGELQNEPPTAPTIDGKSSGKTGTSYTYKFTSNDPDGNDVSYYIKWGDGSVTDWTALQVSGPPGYTEAHSWDNQGTYTVEAKAKDIYGAEGDWAELKVTMPRNRAINTPFLNFLQNHPNLFQMLRMLFQRLGLQ